MDKDNGTTEKSVMKICYLGDPSNSHMRDFISHFALRHSVSLIFTEPKERADSYKDMLNELKNHYIAAYPLKRKWPRALGNTLATRKLLKQIKPNILHAFGATEYGSIGAGSGFHPLIVTAYESDMYVKGGIKTFRRKRAFSAADSIFCEDRDVGDRIAKMIKSRQDFSPVIVKNIQRGVDTNRFSPEMSSENVTATFGHKIVTYSGGFDNRFDITSYLEAIPAILNAVPDTSFVFQINPTLSEDPDAVSRFIASGIFRNPQIASQVFFQGVRDYQIFNHILASAQVHIDLSLSGFGLTEGVAEAMASGIPVVVTNVGENAKWVQEGVGGYITPLHSPDDIAERIIYLLTNDAVSNEMGMRNRKEMETKYDYDDEMNRMENEYKKLYE